MVEEEQGTASPAYLHMQQQQQYQPQAPAGWGAQAPPQQQQQQAYGYQQPAAPQQPAPQQQAQLGALLQQLLAGAAPGGAAPQQQGYAWQQGGGGGLVGNPAFQQLVQQLPREQQAQVVQLVQGMPPGEQAQFLTLLQRTASAGGQQAQQAAPAPQQFAQPQPQAGYGGYAQQAPTQLNAWEQQQVAAQQQQAAAQQQQQAAAQQQQQQQEQQQAAAAWPTAARQLLEAMASLPNASVILQQPPPPFNQASLPFLIGMQRLLIRFCALTCRDAKSWWMLLPAACPDQCPPSLVPPLPQGSPVVDLNTIATRLANAQYGRPLDFAADAGRMFTGFATGAR